MIAKTDNKVDEIIGSIELEVISTLRHDIYLGRGTPGEQVDHFLDKNVYPKEEKLRKITIHFDEERMPD